MSKAPKDYGTNFRRRFGYNELFTWKAAPYTIRHISEFISIKYDESIKGIPREECYLFSSGVLPYMLGLTPRSVRNLVNDKKILPTEYFDGRQRWYSTAYIKIIEHHRKQSYNYKSGRILTPLCLKRLHYICGEATEVSPMPLKNPRAKGNAFERKVANQLKSLYPNARRGLQFQNRFSGVTVPDVEGTPFWIECKHRIRPNIVAAMQQALKEKEFAKDDRIPIAITKANNEDPLVTLLWEDFFGMIKRFEFNTNREEKVSNDVDESNG